MSRDQRHDILFEPIKIGPKTAKNRLFQAPHCIGAGSDRPGFQAHHRAVKAEGGWGVVSTEYCAVAPEAEDVPRVSARLWDNGDVRNLGLMVDMVHEHDALACVELFYGGPFSAGLESRMRSALKTPSHMTAYYGLPTATREMSKQEIREVQAYYVRAAMLARNAAFDIICILSTPFDLTGQFLLPGFNRRTDEYGGSLKNRARFALETYDQVREAVGGEMALTVRFGVDTLDLPHGLGKMGIRVQEDGGAFMEMADPLVDMWDLVVGGTDWGEQAGPSRTHPENWSAEIMKQARRFTQKPTANVGRLTNPDVMAEMVRGGQCDVISAARPTIADPYLPNKIAEGRLEDIRECIGCNQCIARFEIGGPPIVCTQNATVGEEYRRGWHPERFTKATNADTDVLVIGAGPAGMECARVLGERGMRRIHLVDAADEIGGHLRPIVQLPGLGEWRRVINYRQVQLAKLKNVAVMTSATLTKSDVLEYGAEIVIVATGASWSPVGLNGVTNEAIPGADATMAPHVLTPDQVFAGKDPGAHVLVYDVDGYFMGVSLAEQFACEGRRVTLVAASAEIAPFTAYTLERPRILRRLRHLDVTIIPNKVLAAVAPGSNTLVDLWDDSRTVLPSDTVVLVTQRLPTESLFVALRDDPEALQREGIASVYRVGDCAVPGSIADSIFDGHRLAREIDSPHPAYPMPYIRERRLIGASEEDYATDSPTIAINSPPIRSEAAI